MTTYSLFSDAKRDTALTAVGGEMMGTQDTELLKQIFVAAGNATGGGGGGSDPWSPNSFAFIDPVNGNDTTGDGTSALPWATANRALTDGIHRWIIAPGDAGSVTWENVSGDGDFYVFGFAANDFIETGTPVNDPQTQIEFICNGVNNEHLHIYSNKGVTINVTGHSSGATGPDVSIFNAITGDIDLSGNNGGEGQDGGIGGLLSINDCLVLGSVNCDAGQAGDGGNPGNGGVIGISKSEVRGSISALGYGGTASQVNAFLSLLNSDPLADSISLRSSLVGGISKFSEASFVVTGGGSNSISLVAPFSIPADKTFFLPGIDGSSGQPLTTSGTGALSFGTLGVAGGGTGLTSVGASGNILTSNGSAWTSASPAVIVGSGSPEGVVTATVGKLYTRTDGGAGSTLYVKESGSGNTGWIAK